MREDRRSKSSGVVSSVLGAHLWSFLAYLCFYFYSQFSWPFDILSSTNSMSVSFNKSSIFSLLKRLSVRV